MPEIKVTVNGVEHEAECESRLLLVHFLRDVARATSVHVGCVVGRCGACTVLWDGKPVKSCMAFAVQARGADIQTVEGLSALPTFQQLQEAFCAKDAVECGYCTSGMLVSAFGLLGRNPRPTDAEIKEAISGNLCRCTGYVNIVDAVKSAAQTSAASISSR